MFGRRFAFAFAARPWGGRWRWRRGGRGWWMGGWRGRRRLGWYMRRGFFGRGGPFGPGGPSGDEDFPGFPGGPVWGRRFFGRGDLKYALLELLQERPMHGYEMMKELQERTGGMYTPSPGSIYPTLQMLEDRGFVTVSEVEGKKVYTITDAGRAFLAEGQQEERGGACRRGPWHPAEEEWPEIAAFWQELRSFGPLLAGALHSAMRDPERLRRLRAWLAQVRTGLEEIAGQTDRPGE